jgi:hypothetical protein
MSPSDRVAKLCPQAPGSLFIAFYNLQGYSGGILTGLYTGRYRIHILHLNGMSSKRRDRMLNKNEVYLHHLETLQPNKDK